jgi:hypothetical protein
MSRRPTQDVAPDLFSMERLGDGSAKRASTATAARLSRPILPKDLTKAMTYLDDKEFDRLFQATVDEAERRGALPKRFKVGLTRPAVDTDRATKMTLARPTPSLTQGQINAVRASFKAGVTPSQIARQFGLSRSDVRWALAAKVSKGNSDRDN